MKRLVTILGISFLVVALLLPGCAQAPAEVEGPVTIPTVPTAPAAPAPPKEAGISEDADLGGTPGTISSVDEERMIVRSGDMSLVVEDVVESRDEIARLAKRLGGYVVSSWISGEDEDMRGSISIRVPDEDFDQALVELRSLAVRVESENTNSRDVTEEYIDLEARLKNAEATEAQYLNLLDKAQDVEDILRIYDSLSRVRREIEQIKGQMTYLERTSSMSLISAYLKPVASAKPLVPTGWNALEALKSAIRGIVTLGQWLVTLLIWIVFLVPIWGTALGIFYWRRNQRKKAASGNQQS